MEQGLELAEPLFQRLRIGRMQRALSAGRGESWARTAVEHGWYDEAHMANDVRALAGATPHALLRP